MLGKAKFNRGVGSIYGDVETILNLPYQGNLTASDEIVEVAKIPAHIALNEFQNCHPLVRGLLRINAKRVIKDTRLLNEYYTPADMELISNELIVARQMTTQIAAE